MIIDRQTNKLFLTDCLPDKYPEFFKRFKKTLNECGIIFEFLPHTKDVWAVDYMPIQVTKDKFVQFRYEPDYIEDPSTISDVDEICRAINLKPEKSTINLDGGNVSQWKDNIIMCDKIFEENPELSEDDLYEELVELFEVDEIFFVPWDEHDFTGHSEGMVRFVNEDTVLINDYSQEDPSFQHQFKKAIKETGLEWIELPYNPEDDPEETSAVGLYLNYLEMEQAVIVPVFNLQTDEKAVRILEEVFQGKNIRTIECTQLARTGGGIINCITWNIKH